MRSAIWVGSRRLMRRVMRLWFDRLSLSVTTRPAMPLALARSATFSESRQMWPSRISGSAVSSWKVVSFEMPRTGSLAETRRRSSPRARCHSRSPVWPKRAWRSRRSQRRRSAKVRMPAASSAAWPTSPTPHMRRTGLSRRKSEVSARPMTEKPRGLSRSEATLARNLLYDSPMEPVMPSSCSIRRARRASMTAGGAWWRRCVPVRSRNASSRERGSTMGVRSSIIARIWRETST